MIVFFMWLHLDMTLNKPLLIDNTLLKENQRILFMLKYHWQGLLPLVKQKKNV